MIRVLAESEYTPADGLKRALIAAGVPVRSVRYDRGMFHVTYHPSVTQAHVVIAERLKDEHTKRLEAKPTE